VTRVAVKEGLFEPLEDHGDLRLIGGSCRACTRRHFPSQRVCPYCGEASCEPAALSRSGTVHLCTTVISRPPGYEGPAPYGFGVVELDDGIRVISRILDPDRAAVGTSVEIALEVIGSDADGREIVTYAFRPRAASDEPRATPR